jgi:ribulose-bisphosphate carboxylase small chain
MFDLHDAAGVMQEIKACRAAHPETYVRLNAFDSTRGWESVRLSFLVQRPSQEPGFRLERQEAEGRTVRYTLQAYGVDRPAGRRYGPEQARSQ